MKRMIQRKTLIHAAGVMVFAVFLLASCSQPEDINPTSGNNGNINNNTNAMGDDAPIFKLTALNGTTFDMADQDNKVVILFFFGNSCPSCRAVGPDIQKKINEVFKDKSDFVIVGLDVWDGNNSAMNSFKDLTGISFPLLLNASDVAKSYGTTYDRLIVVDKKGKIAHKGTRAASNDISTVEALVKDLLNDM